jgi:hypothetical protein
MRAGLNLQLNIGCIAQPCRKTSPLILGMLKSEMTGMGTLRHDSRLLHAIARACDLLEAGLGKSIA